MQWVIGIDIGGTNCVVGAVAADGSRVVGEHAQPTLATRGAGAVIGDLVTMSQHAIAQVRGADPSAEILGVGAGAPGPLHIAAGMVLFTPNLGWVNVPLRQLLADGLGIPAAIENDANAAVQAECWVGAAREARYVIGLTLGTGIGGGIVIDGVLYHGASDAAGEFGHMVIDPGGPLCGCGNHGCLEAFASGMNIARRAREAVAGGEPSLLSPLLAADPAAITAERVYHAAAQGDATAQRVVDDTVRYLGIGVANLVNIFNPNTVVMLGGVTHAGDALFVPLRREVAARAFKSAVDVCTIVPGALGHLAGVYGAAKAFLDQRASGQV
ncbi:MAG TPA: ROK family protein [Gemmatimonadales bacterium]|jgi:glucokinase